MSTVEEIRARWAAAIPGPWRWAYNDHSIELEARPPGGGRPTVMDFVRRGMFGAQPRFADKRKN